MVWMKSPVTSIREMLMAWPPGLVRITIWLGVAPPKITLPKPITLVDRRTSGRGARMPVPVSVVALTAAAFSALLVKIIWAVFAPVVVGVNVMESVQLASGAMLAHVLWPVNEKLSALMPASLNALMMSGAAPVLLMIRFRTLVVLRAWSPNATTSVTLMTGTGFGVPLPLRLMVSGVSDALLKSVICPLCTPIVVGLNTMAN